MNTDLSPLTARASQTHGLFRHCDAMALGLSNEALRHLVVRRWCTRVARGVFRIEGAPKTADQALLAAVWASDDDAVASHRAAARLWGIPGFDWFAPETTRPRGQNQRLKAGVVHTTLVLPERHRAIVRSIPVTSPARTIFDLAGVVHPGRTERALDFALQRKLCTMLDVHQAFSALARRGRRGTVTMRRLLEERGVGYVPPASELERAARELFASAGLPMPDFETDLGSDEWIGRVDCYWRAHKLILEVDSELHHGSLSDRRDDRRRENRLVSAGWRVLRITWDDLKRRPDEVVRWIREAMRGTAAA